ncbi:MAG: hypothetical protein ACFFCS_15520 [Candidatus Hodarchaeota archaeon]
MAYPPVEGVIRIPLLLLEATLVFISFRVSLLFFKYYKKLQDSVKGTKMHAAWCGLFLGYSIMAFIYIIADYFILDYFIRTNYLQIAYLAVATGAFSFTYFMEKLAIVHTRRIFTILFGILFVIMIVMIFLSHFITELIDINQYFTYTFMLPMIGLFFFYLYKLNTLLPSKLKIYTFSLVLFILVFVFGFLGATDFAIENFGMGIMSRLLGICLQIFGVLIIAFFFLRLPTWNELEWKDTLHSIIVFYTGGISMYQHDFKQKGKEINPILISGALEMVTSLLNEVLPQGELKVLDIQEKKILVKQGVYISVAMIADAKLESLELLLAAFLTEFEQYFGQYLPDWEGDTDIFAPTKAIIKKIFG